MACAMTKAASGPIGAVIAGSVTPMAVPSATPSATGETGSVMCIVIRILCPRSNMLREVVKPFCLPTIGTSRSVAGRQVKRPPNGRIKFAVKLTVGTVRLSPSCTFYC